MNAQTLFSPAWIAPRKPMLLAINVGNVTWLGAAALAFAFWPDVAVRSGPAERLAFAAELAIGPALVGALVIMSCMRLFDTDRAEDPFAGAESRGWKVNQRVLQNTVEQAMIFLPALFGLAVRIDDSHLKVLPIIVTLWCTGRLLFWIGYRHSIIWRAPGFDWTFNTTLCALGWFVTTLF